MENLYSQSTSLDSNDNTIENRPQSQRISEKLLTRIFMFLIVIYTLSYGIFNFDALYSIPLSLSTMVILIPILLTDVIKICLESFMIKRLYTAKGDINKVSVIIPTHNGEETLENTIKNLLRRFDHKRITVVSNGSTDSSSAIAKRLNVQLLTIDEPIGKVEAIHQGLNMVETEQVLIMDDDTLLGDAVLPTSAIDEGYEAVAFRVLPIKKGWISMLQLHEYRKSMDIGRGYHNTSATVQSISGAIGLFHINELKRQINLHTGEFSGEDLQRTLLIHTSPNSKGVIIADSTVETEVPDTLKSLFNQRVFGWNPGQLANFGLYTKLIFKKNVPFKLRFEAFYNNFIVTLLDPLRLISLPILLFSPTYIVIFYVTYVLLETIPHIAMGRKEPYWVILLSPFYGLFNFIARVLANAVFLYRRLSYKFANFVKYDDYKHADLTSRTISVTISSSLLGSLLFGYSYFSYLPENTLALSASKLSQASSVSPLSKTTVVKKPVLTPAPTLPKANDDYVHTIVLGDSIWKISKDAINTYLINNNYYLGTKNKALFHKKVIDTQQDKVVRLNTTYIITKKSLDENYKTLFGKTDQFE